MTCTLPQLVKLSMAASRLTDWLPWFVSMSAVEAQRAVEATEPLGNRGGGQGTDARVDAPGGLSPEVLGHTPRY